MNHRRVVSAGLIIDLCYFGNDLFLILFRRYSLHWQCGPCCLRRHFPLASLVRVWPRAGVKPNVYVCIFHTITFTPFSSARPLAQHSMLVSLSFNSLFCSHFTFFTPITIEQVARALLKNGAAVNSQSNNGFSALMLSAQNGHEQV